MNAFKLYLLVTFHFNLKKSFYLRLSDLGKLFEFDRFLFIKIIKSCDKEKPCVAASFRLNKNVFIIRLNMLVK